MKNIPNKALDPPNAREIKMLISTGHSLLDTLYAKNLRLGMSIAGLVCQFLVWMILHNKKKYHGKHRAGRTVKFFFPTTFKKIDYINTTDPHARVIYFNHQSLFEVLATIWYCLTYYPDKHYLFPCNLPWYEGLARITSKLECLGIYITPMITPHTYTKLRKRIEKNDASRLPLLSKLKTALDNEYARLVKIFAENIDIIAIAPSATRTPFIFPSKAAYDGTDQKAISAMPTAMSSIVFTLRHLKSPVDFIPFVVTRKHRAGKGLRIFRKHDIYIGPRNTLPEMLAEKKAGTVDYNCYHCLARHVPRAVKYP